MQNNPIPTEIVSCPDPPLNYTIPNPLKALSSLELVLLCKSGHERALIELMRRHRGSVFKAAYRLTRDYEEAEDVASSTCLRICRGIVSCKHPEALAAWINRIVRNVWLDSLRRSTRRSEVSLDLLENISSEGRKYFLDGELSVPVYKQAEENERKKIISRAISTLPSCQIRIVNLFYTENRPYEEIAEIMDIPVGTVKSRLSRARNTLHRKLSIHLSALMD